MAKSPVTTHHLCRYWWRRLLQQHPVLAVTLHLDSLGGDLLSSLVSPSAAPMFWLDGMAVFGGNASSVLASMAASAAASFSSYLLSWWSSGDLWLSCFPPLAAVSGLGWDVHLCIISCVGIGDGSCHSSILLWCQPCILAVSVVTGCLGNYIWDSVSCLSGDIWRQCIICVNISDDISWQHLVLAATLHLGGLGGDGLSRGAGMGAATGTAM